MSCWWVSRLTQSGLSVMKKVVQRVAGLVLVAVLVVLSAAQCGAQYYCYRDHPTIAVLGGCSMGGSGYTSTRDSGRYYHHTPSKGKQSSSKSSRGK